MTFVRTQLPDGCFYDLYDNGSERWYNSIGAHRVDGPAIKHKWRTAYLQNGKYHRLDGPAIIHGNDHIEYWVNGEIPKSILDIVIIDEEIDHMMFPSADLVIDYYGRGGLLAYRIHDPDELTLAILRYS